MLRIKLTIFETKLQLKLLLLWTAKQILLLSLIANLCNILFTLSCCKFLSLCLPPLSQNLQSHIPSRVSFFKGVSYSIAPAHRCVHPVRLRGQFQKYLLVKSHNGFATVRVMKLCLPPQSQHLQSNIPQVFVLLISQLFTTSFCTWSEVCSPWSAQRTVTLFNYLAVATRTDHEANLNFLAPFVIGPLQSRIMMSGESTQILSNYTTQTKIKTNSTPFARTTDRQVLTICSNKFIQQSLCHPRIWITKKKFYITKSLIWAVGCSVTITNCLWNSGAANLWSSAKACGKWLWNE